jgi:hypothetical protein
MNNCHAWDPILRSQFHSIRQKLPIVDEEASIRHLILTFANTKYSACIERMSLLNSVDSNIDYRTRHLVAQTWSVVHESKDKVEIFTNQLDDMMETSGYCEQGWSNRMMQVLFACDVL